MNLENSYGNNDSLVEVFNKSLQYNEHKIMYLKLAEIYERSENTDVCIHEIIIVVIYLECRKTL
jgi:hypothetical protein